MLIFIYLFKKCLFHYIKQCIENCDVLPIYCPDPKCLMKGSLDQQEIKQILLTNKLLLDENNNKNIFNNNTKICYIDCEVINEKDNLIKSETESDSSDYLYKRYLKLYENIGKSSKIKVNKLILFLFKFVFFSFSK